jgi:uracil DNA glycosylase
MELEDYIEESWREQLADFLGSSSWEYIKKKVEQSYAQPFCFPPKDQIFRAFELTSFDSDLLLFKIDNLLTIISPLSKRQKAL